MCKPNCECVKPCVSCSCVKEEISNIPPLCSQPLHNITKQHIVCRIGPYVFHSNNYSYDAISAVEECLKLNNLCLFNDFDKFRFEVLTDAT